MKPNFENGLLPTIVQHAQTAEVLMLAYMNREAYQLSIDTGRVTFYSRSRRRIWVKGESSGHFLDLQSITADCDGDTILVQALPKGPVCHTGTRTCFGMEPPLQGFLHELDRHIAQRLNQPQSTSYTTQLQQRGLPYVARKVGEEATETLVAALSEGSGRTLSEAADLVYHLLVLLRLTNLDLAQLEAELQRRHQAS